MTISITNSIFTTKRFVSVQAGSSLPDVTISGSYIAAEEVGCEERGGYQAVPVAPFVRREA